MALDPSGLARGGFGGKEAILRLDSLTVSIYDLFGVSVQIEISPWDGCSDHGDSLDV